MLESVMPAESLMDIALFGGRFDPPHIGHLAVARNILKQQLADEVWLIPANTHPWRQMVASAQDRLTMTKLLEEDKIKVSDIEIKRGGETYTIDTVRNILSNKSYSSYRFFLVAGSDQIHDFHRWKDYKELQKLIRFLVFPRTAVSSSIIRERIERGLSILDLVPERVEKYIREKGLYGLQKNSR